jgi:hypothetical protein
VPHRGEYGARPLEHRTVDQLSGDRVRAAVGGGHDEAMLKALAVRS